MKTDGLRHQVRRLVQQPRLEEALLHQGERLQGCAVGPGFISDLDSLKMSTVFDTIF